MKRIALFLALATTVAVAQDSTPPAKPATKSTATKPATGASSTSGAKSTTAAKPTTVPKPGTAVHHPVATSGPKVPANIPHYAGAAKPLFTLQYQDISVGKGPLAEPMKLYKVKYTGWLASDGTKFDSSDDHRQPVTDKDGKPVLDSDGKPQLGEAQPIQFPQGRGRVIPGWDQGFEGMHIGGKRRLFIPYQLAYGAMGRPPKIPAKSDLIFDVELVDVSDMPTSPMPGMPGGRPMPGTPPRPGTPGAPPVPPTPGSSASPGAPTAAPTPSAPASPSVAPAPAAPTTPPPADKPVNPEQPK